MPTLKKTSHYKKIVSAALFLAALAGAIYTGFWYMASSPHRSEAEEWGYVR